MNAADEVPDRIERETVLAAPYERVWRAITDSEQFGAWSGMTFDGPFVADTWIDGTLIAAAAQDQNPDGVPVHWFVESIEPMRSFVFRWHPFPVDHTADYSDEPMVRITITVEPDGERTRLTIVEAGYDGIPPQRRAEAYRGNSEGWDLQLRNLARYVQS